MSEWQPIETAPKDEVGPTVLLWNGESMGTGYWNAWARDDLGRVIGLEEEDPAQFADRWLWTGEGFEVLPSPTHWMPLPEPPK